MTSLSRYNPYSPHYAFSESARGYRRPGWLLWLWWSLIGAATLPTMLILFLVWFKVIWTLSIFAAVPAALFLNAAAQGIVLSLTVRVTIWEWLTATLVGYAVAGFFVVALPLVLTVGLNMGNDPAFLAPSQVMLAVIFSTIPAAAQAFVLNDRFSLPGPLAALWVAVGAASGLLWGLVVYMLSVVTPLWLTWDMLGTATGSLLSDFTIDKLILHILAAPTTITAIVMGLLLVGLLRYYSPAAQS